MAQAIDPDTLSAVAAAVADRFAALPQVLAVALAGSRVSDLHDEASDIDLYVYSSAPVPPAERQRIAAERAGRFEVDNRFWEPGDEWVEDASGARVDVIFRDTRWANEQLRRVIERHEASLGYTTALWHNVLVSHLLFDRNAWFDRLRFLARTPYPNELARAIVAKNHPVLRLTQSSYLHQIDLALRRDDLVSVNHRVAALLASYFDIIFAVNRLPHPGEKRLLDLAESQCRRLPVNMRADITALLRAAGDPDARVLVRVTTLIDHLDAVLDQEI
jgi:predicted nucleotidyltransferase